LRKLEIVKLIKELDFWESQFKYKSEMIREIDFEFKKEVEGFLSTNVELEEVFTKSVNYSNEKRNDYLNNQILLDTDEVSPKNEKNPKVKSLYRIIAKATHPDKKNDQNLTEIYLEAKKAYEENNLLPIISICDKLRIPFDIDEKEFSTINNEINNLKLKTNFLEKTYTWKWYSETDIVVRTQIILDFIKNQII
jgi:hypothetical protein